MFDSMEAPLEIDAGLGFCMFLSDREEYEATFSWQRYSSVFYASARWGLQSKGEFKGE